MEDVAAEGVGIVLEDVFDIAAAREHLARRDRGRTRRIQTLEEQARKDVETILQEGKVVYERH